MLYKNWEPFYQEIKKDLNLNFKKDKTAAEILNNILDNQKNVVTEKKLKNIIHGKEVIVFGAGNSLKKSIKKHIKSSFFKNSIKISADGATTALIEEDILPDIITTDLDGKLSDQIKANQKGSIMIVHAHGDNIKKIKEITACLDGKIFGTTQINPESYKNLYNYGGFTDGDRAVYLAEHFDAKKIYLTGFDFSGKIGKYSNFENKDQDLKKKKLVWCELLIKRLNQNIIVFV